MKSYNIIRQITLLLICLGIFSCSNDSDEIDRNTPGTQDSYVSATLETMNLPANLQCDLYIFWKSASDTEYSFKDKVTLAGTQSRIKFMNHELFEKEYRFLFIATSKANPEISVSDLGNNTLDTSKKWNDVLISANEMLLSSDNYSGILDKTGDEILDEGSIDGILTRMVGQIVLDIFRVDGSIEIPMDIVSGDVTSVLDRVFKVEVEYEDLTKGVTFGTSNEVLHKTTWSEIYTKTHLVTYDGDLKVSPSQASNGLEASPVNKAGSVRLKGIYCLPSKENMRIKYTFHYYDTTPTCGNTDGGKHDTDCFDKRTLVLNLPQDIPGSTLLSVYPDYFTVNKAGIRYDRIIDLKMDSSISFETEWSK